MLNYIGFYTIKAFIHIRYIILTVYVQMVVEANSSVVR
jgi:hypothetical protein